MKRRDYNLLLTFENAAENIKIKLRRLNESTKRFRMRLIHHLHPKLLFSNFEIK